MEVSRIQEIVIFESPDGGQTVYQRNSGSGLRELVTEKNKTLVSFQQWQDIIKLSKTNLAIKESLDQLIVLYELSKENN